LLNDWPKHVLFQIKKTKCFSLWLVWGEVCIQNMYHFLISITYNNRGIRKYFFVLPIRFIVVACTQIKFEFIQLSYLQGYPHKMRRCTKFNLSAPSAYLYLWLAAFVNLFLCQIIIKAIQKLFSIQKTKF